MKNNLIIDFKNKEQLKPLLDALNVILEILRNSSMRKALERFFIRFNRDNNLDKVFIAS